MLLAPKMKMKLMNLLPQKEKMKIWEESNFSSFYARLAQPVEHLTYIQGVGGSNPSPGTSRVRENYLNEKK